MKKIIFIGCILLTGVLSAQNSNSEAWRDDLDYLIGRIEIMHPGPYAYFSKEDFYKLSKKLYDEIPKLTDTEVIISISELLASLRDGHTRWAFEKSDPQWLMQTFNVLPIIQYAFADGTYIMAGLPQYKEFVGLKVIKIGKMLIEEVQEKLGKIWSHDNKSGELKYLYYTLCIPEMLKIIGAIDDTNKIDFVLLNENNEEIKTQLASVPFMSMAGYIAGTWYPQKSNGLFTINESALNSLPLWLKNPDKNFWFEYVPETKMMFLQINSLNYPRGDAYKEGSFNQLCAKFFEALDQSAAEKLMIDLRANNGGNHVELPLLKGIIARPHIDQQGKLFVVTGRVTYSAAVHLTTVLKKYTNITIIGEPASGRPNHYGAVRGFNLPNHPFIRIDCSIDYYQDSEPYDFNIVNAPDIEIKMTSADYKNNIDRAMEAVLNYQRTCDLVKSLSAELGEVYISQGVSGFKRQFNNKKQVLVDTGYNIEKFLFQFEDKFLSGDTLNPSALLDFLSFANEICPKSIDLTYSLAVQLESQGKYDEAASAYARCIKQNPEHHYAKMKLNLMKLSKGNP